MKTLSKISLTMVMTVVALAAFSATAEAAGFVGYHTAPQCGYTVQSGTIFEKKYATTFGLKVAAYNGMQYVYARFQWYERATIAGARMVAAGAPEWRWTLASRAAYSNTWYTFGSNDATVPVARFAGLDANDPEPYPDVFLHVSLYWYTGQTVTGSIGYWAKNPNNLNNPFVCNGGGWLGNYNP